MAALCALTTSIRGHEAVNVAHGHLDFLNVTTSYDLVDSVASTWINVTWKVLKPATSPSNTHEYLVTISSDDPIAATYSMLTLGLQSRGYQRGIRLHNAFGGTVEYFATVAATASTPFPPRLALAFDNQGNDQIALLRFSGPSNRYEFIVTEVTAHGPATHWRKKGGFPPPGDAAASPNKAKAAPAKKDSTASMTVGHDNDPPKNPPD